MRRQKDSPPPPGDFALPVDLIPIRAATGLLPSRRPGKRLALSTLYRWLAQGRLRSWKLVGGRFVSRREVLGLMREEQPARLPEPAVARERAQAEALEQLRAAGWRV
jgi:hypothetical protein